MTEDDDRGEYRSLSGGSHATLRVVGDFSEVGTSFHVRCRGCRSSAGKGLEVTLVRGQEGGDGAHDRVVRGGLASVLENGPVVPVDLGDGRWVEAATFGADAVELEDAGRDTGDHGEGGGGPSVGGQHADHGRLSDI